MYSGVWYALYVNDRSTVIGFGDFLSVRFGWIGINFKNKYTSRMMPQKANDRNMTNVKRFVLVMLVSYSINEHRSIVVIINR